MKKMQSLSRKQLLFYSTILLFFTILILLLFQYKKDEKRFTKLTHNLFVEEMTANTLSMHYNLAFPEAFGIHDYKPVLPAYNPQAGKASAEAIENTLQELSRIRPEKLSDKDAYTYELLTRMLQNSQDLNEYTLYQAPLSPSSGMQSQLPILLAEYTFRTPRDVEDYLALLDQTDEYFASLLLFERERMAAGMCMSSYSLKQVKEQCDTILTQDALAEGNHFLQTTFKERVSHLICEGLITESQAQQYISENDRLLRTVMQPAYEALADGLFLMEDADGVSPMPVGLASHPDGKEYYQHLLISETGSYRSVEEVKTMLQNKIQAEYGAIVDLVSANPDLATQMEGLSYTDLPCDDAETMLADLQFRMQDTFPRLPKDDTVVTVKEVSPNLQEYCAPAFYLTTPLDDTGNNVIYINTQNPLTDLDLYTTLAHEGYPGHLYQTVYNNLDFQSGVENKARQLLWYGGYLEGWALYVEFYGYDYAAKLLEESGRKDDALCVQLEKHNRSLLLCLYSMMDIMIHYENASPDELAVYLEDFGIKSPSAVNAVYCYIADEPCNYLKYYLGYLEFLELKEIAQTLWQDHYTDYGFHCFVLDAGPSDFTSLTERLQNTPTPRND